MAERHQVRATTPSPGNAEEKKPTTQRRQGRLSQRRLRRPRFLYPIIELDRRTVRVAESLDREQQQFDANGEVVKASGTWTKAEHERFLRAMETFPKGPWKAIAEMVATRTVRQTQTHAQKYREKLARRMRGLRNRNDDSRYGPRLVGYLNTSPAPHPGAMGYVAPSTARMVSAPMVSMAPGPSLVPSYFTTAMPIHRSSFHHTRHLRLHPMSASMAMVSSEFSQLSPSTISSAFPTVPDFDESMDFLMMCTRPTQSDQHGGRHAVIGADRDAHGCIPTPQTHHASSAMKRHRATDSSATHNTVLT
ncbi:Myb domain [Phytophthora cactorum]|nr:Myb domain [Phytophthora cactorum]